MKPLQPALRLSSLALRRRLRTASTAQNLQRDWQKVEHALDAGDWQAALGALSALPADLDPSLRSELSMRLRREWDRLLNAKDLASAAWVDHLLTYLDGSLSSERKQAIQELVDLLDELEAKYADVAAFRRHHAAQVEALQGQLAAIQQERDAQEGKFNQARQAHEQDHEALKMLLSQSDQAISDLQTKVTALEQEKADAERKIQELSSRPVQVQDTSKLEKQIDAYNKQVLDLQKKLLTIGSQELKERQKLEAAHKRELEELKKASQDTSALLQGQKENAEREVERLKTRIERSAPSVIDKQEKQKLLSELSQLRDQLAQALKEQEKLAKEKQKLQVQLDEEKNKNKQRTQTQADTRGASVEPPIEPVPAPFNAPPVIHTAARPLELQYAYVPQVLDLPIPQGLYISFPPLLLAVKTSRPVDPLAILLKGKIYSYLYEKDWSGSIIASSAGNILSFQEEDQHYLLIKDPMRAVPSLRELGSVFHGSIENVRLSISSATFSLDNFTLGPKQQVNTMSRVNAKGLIYLDGSESVPLTEGQTYAAIAYCEYGLPHQPKIYYVRLEANLPDRDEAYLWLPGDEVSDLEPQKMKVRLPCITPLYTIRPLELSEIIAKLKPALRKARLL